MVYRRIKDDIVMARLEPGTFVDEISLAELFHVSRTPIREALRRLEQDGLVATIPRRGTLVCRPTLQDIEEIDHIRLLLEPAAARLAAGRVNADALEKIADELTRLAQSRKQDVAKFLEVDLQLHNLVLLSSGNSHIQKIVSGLHDKLSATRGPSAHSRVSKSIGELLDLVQALRVGDGEAAEAAMRKHLLASRDNRHKLFRSDPDDPDKKMAADSGLLPSANKAHY